MLASMSGWYPAVLYGGDVEIRADSGQHKFLIYSWNQRDLIDIASSSSV